MKARATLLVGVVLAVTLYFAPVDAESKSAYPHFATLETHVAQQTSPTPGSSENSEGDGGNDPIGEGSGVSGRDAPVGDAGGDADVGGISAGEKGTNETKGEAGESSEEEASQSETGGDGSDVVVGVVRSAGRDSELTVAPPCAQWGLEEVIEDGGEGEIDPNEVQNQELLDHINDRATVSVSDQARFVSAAAAQEDSGVDGDDDAALEGDGDDPGEVVFEEVCLVEYVCGAERIDDVVSGHIEGEADGAYAEYVIAVAALLDALTADIRRIEENPVLGEGEVAPEIPEASSEQGVQQLTRVLAERGLGDEPGELFLPVLNYCRIGAGGPIEVSATPEDPVASVSFTWVLLADEFDIPGASQDLFSKVERRLKAERPQMRTTPPMDTGVTVVQFPMWMWLHEPFTFTTVEAVSEPNGTVRVRGRATFDHVLWQMGPEEVRCELDDMEPYVSGGDPADEPPCSHTFTKLVSYQAKATVVYRVEQQVSTRRASGYPYFEGPWTAHPVQEYVPVVSTGPQINVREILSLNVPITIGAGDN